MFPESLTTWVDRDNDLQTYIYSTPSFEINHCKKGTIAIMHKIK